MESSGFPKNFLLLNVQALCLFINHDKICEKIPWVVSDFEISERPVVVEIR